METVCPHCSQRIEIDPATLQSLRGRSHFDCPACSWEVEVPVPPARPASGSAKGGGRKPAGKTQEPSDNRHQSPATGAHPSPATGARQGAGRNLRVLGVVTLLILGGVAAFLAAQNSGSILNRKRDITNDVINNRFFTDLAASGKTTAEALRRSVAAFQPLGAGFVGVSREKLPAEKARELAESLGGEVLTVDGSAPAMREALTDALEDGFADLRGSTVWVRDPTGESRGMDIPRVRALTTPDRPRPVFVHWRPTPPRAEPVLLPSVRILSTDPPLSADPARPTVLRLAQDWVRVDFEYDNPGVPGLHASGYPCLGGEIARGYGNDGMVPLPPGKGRLRREFFLFSNPGAMDAAGVSLIVVRPDGKDQDNGIAALLPGHARWEVDATAWQIELLSVKPPAALSANGGISLRATAGEKFKMELTARYKTPVAAKLASNLLQKDAGILPPEFIAELSASHSATWHFDTQSRPGYSDVKGEGEISYDLTGYAPREPGTWTFDANLGLFDKQTWATRVLKFHKVTLTAVPAAPPGATDPATVAPESGHTWYSRDGREVRAEFVRLTDSAVVIRKAGGREFTLPLTKLKPESAALAKKLAAAPSP